LTLGQRQAWLEQGPHGLRRVNRGATLVAALVLSTALGAIPATAGPPYLTDDPEPVEYRHWEVYAASQWFVSRHAADGTAPHVEVNYGALPELQLHAIVPAALALRSGQAVRYGLGDIELGVKYRFVDETERRPQIGTFPLVLLPTGSAARGLGSGKMQALLPIWVQKSFGRWTTYGGGGIRLASGERDGVAGWLVQRGLGKSVTLGTEAFLTVPLSRGSTEIRINLGLVIDFSTLQHLLLSAGPAFGGDVGAQSYAAYQLTF
jgi:hypothetical protein